MNFSRTPLLIALISLISVPQLFAQSDDITPFVLTPAPGTYRDDIAVDIRADLEYETILYRVEGYDSSQLVSADETLLLSAPSGSRRRYRIELLLITQGQVQENAFVEYIIDRKAPAVPVMDLVPGLYRKPIEITPSGEDASAFVYVLVGPEGTSRGTIEPGQSLLISGNSGQLSAYQLQIGAVDEAGNTGDRSNFRYVLDRRSETRVSRIPLVSPSEGDFANPQLLYIDDRGFSELRYSLDGSDPRISGAPYTNPVLLPPGEGIQLRVFGVTHDGRQLYESRIFSAGINEYAALEQGFISENISIPALRANLYYRVDDQAASRFDTPLDRPLRISLQAGSLRALPLRIYDAVEGGEYRYLFLLEGRRPSIPDVQLSYFDESLDRFVPASEGDILSRRILIRSRGDTGSETYYRLDGGLPEEGSELRQRLYDSEELLLPDGIESIELVLQSVVNGVLWGEPRTLSFSLSDEKTDVPEVQILPDEQGLEIRPESSVLLEFIPAPPGFEQFVFSEPTRLNMPKGIEQQYRLRFYSVSEVGTLSESFLDIEGIIDTRLPSGPEIRIADRSFTLAGPETESSGDSLFYRLIRQGSSGYSGGGEFYLYNGGSVELPAEQGENIGYIIEAFAETSGGRSAISRSPLIPVHSATPAAASLLGIADGQSVSGDSLSLRISNPEPGMRYYYAVGRDGQIPGDPFPGDQYTSSEISIELDSGAENQQISLVILPVSSEDESLRGVVTRLNFTFDNSPPSPPVLENIAAGREYRESVDIRLRSDGGVESYFEVLRDDGDYLVPPDSAYRGPYSVAGIEGRRVLYTLRAYSVDNAGNRSETTSARFTIDREFPDFPVLSVRREDGAPVPSLENQRFVSNGDLVLSFESDETVVYDLVTGIQLPEPPDANSPAYAGPIKLDSPGGTETRYRLLFRSIDNAGNLGQLSGIFDFLVDRRAPDAPDSPRVQRDGNAGFFCWNLTEDQRIEYTVLPSGISPETVAFDEYQFPVEWEVGENQESLVLYYRSRDEAGNASPMLSLVLPRLQIAPLPKISGVQDGGVYVQPRAVEVFPGSGGLVRYEISSDGSEPSAVTETSPVWSSRLTFQATSGETVFYRIRLRQFVPGFEPSEELAFSFTLDRSAPPPPEIRGLEDQRYASEPVIIDFLTEDDGQAVYQISEYRYPSGDLPLRWDGDFTAPAGMDVGSLSSFSRPFSLEGLPGELILYNIRAYAFDAAGNRSAQDRTWNVIVDRRNVYVSPYAEAGGDGSREAPFAAIADALLRARQDGRQEIYLAAGSYSLLAALEFDFSVGLFGGFRETNWEPVEEDSFVFADKSYSAPNLLRSRNSRLSLQNIYLSDSARSLSELIFAENSDVSISDSLLTVSGGSSALTAAGSVIRISRSEISGYELSDATLVRIRASSELSIRDSRLSAEELPSFLEANLHGSYNLLSSEDSQISISRSSLIPASGDSTVAVYLYNSRLSADQGSVFSSGYGTSAASAFFLDGSQLELNASYVQGNENAAVVSLIFGRDSEISLEDSDIVLEAAFGVNGVSLQGGSLLVAGSRFYGAGGRDFTNALVVRGNSELALERSDFSGAETAEYIAVFIEDSEALIRSNDISFSGKEDYGIAVHIGENTRGIIEGNNFSGSISATAIRLQTAVSEARMQVVGNTFENWGLLLEEFRDSFRSSQQQAGRYQSLQQLESLEGAGLIFTDNTINQGL
jgi:hypothetical protein